MTFIKNMLDAPVSKSSLLAYRPIYRSEVLFYAAPFQYCRRLYPCRSTYHRTAVSAVCPASYFVMSRNIEIWLSRTDASILIAGLPPAMVSDNKCQVAQQPIQRRSNFFAHCRKEILVLAFSSHRAVPCPTTCSSASIPIEISQGMLKLPLLGGRTASSTGTPHPILAR
jgi:hypothetical protein